MQIEAAEEAVGISGLGLVRAVLRHAHERAEHLAIIGHADAVGSGSVNEVVSRDRAENVRLFLVGDRAGWAGHCIGHYAVDDVQTLLAWTAFVRGWACDPGGIDNDLGVATAAALDEFRREYNIEWRASIAESGPITAADFEAFFDVCEATLRDMLDPGLPTLEEQRAGLKVHAVVAAGEAWPRALDLPGYPAGCDRRVDLVFLEEDQLHLVNAESLLELFRRFLVTSRQKEILDTKICKFSPFNDDEKSRWFDGDAVGSLVHIEMRVKDFKSVNIDDGSVVCSHASATEFRVSTVWVGADGYHPVSGNREWGVWRSGSASGIDRIDWSTGKHYKLAVDEWTFYTRGADRLSTRPQDAPFVDDKTFSEGVRLWTSMQARFCSYIHEHGGAAYVRTSISQRADWDTVERWHFAPTTEWVEETA